MFLSCPMNPTPKETLRKLFTDHAVYARMFINAFLDELPETPFLQTRLLANQPEIGQYLGQFIGQEGGKAVGDLLTKHIKLAANVVGKLKENADQKILVYVST